MKRLIPYQYQRQNALPLTDDTVFSTIAEMNDYLSSGNRYAGQTVTCLEDESIYVLNAARNFWLPKLGDGSNIKMVFKPNSTELTKTTAQWSSALGVTLISSNVTGNIVKLSVENEIKLNSYFASNTNIISIESDSIYELNAGAFYGCSALESINFKSLEKCNGIEAANGTFQNCIKLNSINLPKLKYGGTKLFYGCTDIEVANLPLLETVGWQTFYGCTKLKSVKIPLLRQMGLQMFYNCTSLLTIYAPSCEAIGYSLADTSTFYNINSDNDIFELTVDDSLRTCNTSETPDGDISYLLSLRTNNHVVYVNKIDKILTNKSWCSIGDSITWYDKNRTYLMSKGYQSFVKDRYKFTTHTDYVKNGGSVYEMSVFEADPANPQTPPPAAHIYTIMLGVNDMLEGRVLGTLDDYINNTGQGTFYGGYRMIIDRLKTVAAAGALNAYIFPCTPMKSKNFNGMLPSSVYGVKADNTLELLRSAIISIVNYEKGLSTLNTATKHRLDVVDLYELTEFSESEISQYFIDDTLHPNDKGNKIIANKIIRVLESTILNTVGIGTVSNNKAKLAVETYEHETRGYSAGSTTAWSSVIASFSGDDSRVRMLLENRNIDTSAAGGRQVTIIFQSTNIKWQIGTDLNQNNTNDFFIFDVQSLKPRLYIDANGNVSIGKELASVSPKSKLDVNGGVRVANDSDSASADKVGTLRYREDANNSYVEMCMKTGASTYAWELIKQKTW